MISNLGSALLRSLWFHESENSTIIPKTTLSCSVHRIPCSQSRALKAIPSRRASSTSSQKSTLINTLLISARKIRKLQALGSCDFYHTEFPTESRRASNVSSLPSESCTKSVLKRHFPVRYYCISNVSTSWRKR